ncbi:MAG: exodeoxyribonuclease VII small subunit [Planctomycetes bacterium]|nr:exodeoxyribonuclease VII small subunit [Planctomycetota bacterium]
MAKAKKSEATFEELIAAAEARAAAIEDGELGLEEALKAYEKGMADLRAATAIISRVETRVKALTEDAEGRPALSDFAEIAPANDAGDEEGE